jgi:hypothetical protein
MWRVELLGNKHGVIFKEGKGLGLGLGKVRGLQQRSHVPGLPRLLLSINMLHQSYASSGFVGAVLGRLGSLWQIQYVIGKRIQY